MAVTAGFNAIDTANQPRHYSEPLVGEALARLAVDGRNRDSLFIQTKFTPLNGQDHRRPYDPQADLRTQVAQSFESSLKNLNTDRVDSICCTARTLIPRSARKTGKSGAPSKSSIGRPRRHDRYQQRKPPSTRHARSTGEGETDGGSKSLLCKPRLGSRSAPDLPRAGNHVSGFLVVDGKSLRAASSAGLAIAQRIAAQPEQVVFRFAMQAGMVPLTGTTNLQHMKEDLRVYDLELTPEEGKWGRLPKSPDSTRIEQEFR